LASRYVGARWESRTSGGWIPALAGTKGGGDDVAAQKDGLPKEVLRQAIRSCYHLYERMIVSNLTYLNLVATSLQDNAVCGLQLPAR
jgi:hypothetical protein